MLGIEPTEKQWATLFWQIKNDTLAGFFWFCGCFNSIKMKSALLKSTYKSNANTTDFTSSLIEQAIVSEKTWALSLKKKAQSKLWFGVCEGRFLSGWVMRWELLKKLSWSKPLARWLVRMFYIMLLWFIRKLESEQGVFFMNHNATLCNTALG
jgi:hypothetical protein